MAGLANKVDCAGAGRRFRGSWARRWRCKLAWPLGRDCGSPWRVRRGRPVSAIPAFCKARRSIPTRSRAAPSDLHDRRAQSRSPRPYPPRRLARAGPRRCGAISAPRRRGRAPAAAWGLRALVVGAVGAHRELDRGRRRGRADARGRLDQGVSHAAGSGARPRGRRKKRSAFGVPYEPLDRQRSACHGSRIWAAGWSAACNVRRSAHDIGPATR